MFEIEFNGQMLQVISFVQYSCGIVFTAIASDGSSQWKHFGVIYTSKERAQYIDIGSIRLDTKVFTRSIPFDIFPGVEWFKTKTEVGFLGCISVNAGDFNHKMDVKQIDFAHQHSDYFASKDKLYYKQKKFAACLRIALYDDSVLERTWVSNEFGHLEPSWIYKKDGMTYEQPTIIYLDGF